MAGQKPPPRTLDQVDEQKVQRFLARAAPWVLEGPHLDITRWQRLSALAAEMELSPDQLRRTLRELSDRGVLQTIEMPDPKPPPLPMRSTASDPTSPWQNAPDSSFSLTPPPAPDDSQEIPPAGFVDAPDGKRGVPGHDQRKRWRWEDGDGLVPPLPRKGPAATFRDFVRTALEQSREPVLTAEREQELVRHGVTALGLAPVYARDLVVEVAVEADFPRATASPLGSDAHEERAVAFREFVSGCLARLTLPMINAQAEQALAEQGRVSYGVDADRVTEVIQEAARARNLPVISREFAEQNLRTLVNELLDENEFLDPAARERVDAEGRRLGLTAADMESIIDELVQVRTEQQRWERKFTRLALWSAGCAALLVLAFLGWAVVQSHLIRQPTPPRSTVPTAADQYSRPANEDQSREVTTSPSERDTRVSAGLPEAAPVREPNRAGEIDSGRKE